MLGRIFEINEENVTVELILSCNEQLCNCYTSSIIIIIIIIIIIVISRGLRLTGGEFLFAELRTSS
jgi:hypothetical protein